MKSFELHLGACTEQKVSDDVSERETQTWAVVGCKGSV